MPVFNAERYLVDSISSILNQSFKDFEIILINDGSKDNSLNIIKKFKRLDKRIVLINNKSNRGLPKSINSGLRIAKGKYIARMDADDISMPDRFLIQFNYLEEHRDIFLIGSSAEVIDENNNHIGSLIKYDNYRKIYRKLLDSNPLIHPSIMFRNEKILYREKFKASEEYDFYLRLLSLGKHITNLPQKLIKYRVSKNSFVSTAPNQRYFFEKAKQFYRQRTEKGKDEYNSFNLDEIKVEEKPNFDKNNLRAIIIIKLFDNQMTKVRENIFEYTKKYGLDKKMIMTYIISFLPIKLILKIREILSV